LGRNENKSEKWIKNVYDLMLRYCYQPLNLEENLFSKKYSWVMIGWVVKYNIYFISKFKIMIQLFKIFSILKHTWKSNFISFKIFFYFLRDKKSNHKLNVFFNPKKVNFKTHWIESQEEKISFPPVSSIEYLTPNRIQWLHIFDR
jgi:hypothetical protein